MDIKELAPALAHRTCNRYKHGDEWPYQFTEQGVIDFATRLIAAYVEGQEPVEWIYCPECGSEEIHYEEGRYKQCANCHQEWFSDIDYSDVVQSNLSKLFTAPPEPAQNLYREIYEVWAGSEGIPMPRTAPEAYLLGLLEQMVDIAKTGMHMTEPAPQTDGSTTVSAPDQERMSRSACAAPSSEEVQRMIGWLRVELGHLVTCQQAADMIDSLFARVDELKQACDKFSEAEILAARVPDGCVVVPRRDVIFAAGYLQGATTAGTDAEACGARLQKLIAAGDVKP